MIRLASRTACPVNGFQFVDAPISSDPLQTWSFEDLVNQVAARRAQNPRFGLTTDLNAIRQEVDQQNALRMLSIPGASSYVITAPGGPAPNRLASRSQNFTNAVGGFKRVAAGAGALRDWLGDGAVPVDSTLSESRAGVCATCPQNQGGDWLSFFTKPAAEFIRSQLAMRGDLALKTTQDDKLEFCKACSCPLKLKVHVPKKHIDAHTSDAVRAALDPRCWMLKEAAA